MKKQNLVKVLGCLCIFLMVSHGPTKAQSATFTYHFVEAPYPEAATEVLSEDNLNLTNISEIIVLSRHSTPDLHFIFTEAHFYVVFNLSGMREVYKIPYQESVSGYEAQCSLNSIDPERLSCKEMLSAVLKYHTR